MRSKTRAVLVVALAGITSLGLMPGVATAGPTASIAGTVRAAGSGAPVAGVSVDLFALKTNGGFGGHTVKGPGFVAATTTASDGTYTLSGLAPSTGPGYWVCFDPGFLGPFEGQCYLDQPGFSPFPDPFGFFAVPPGSTTIVLGAGHHVSGIDADLVDPSVINPDTAGSVAGRVTQSVLNLALTGVRVTAFDSAGNVVGQALTGKGGTYVIADLLGSTTGYAVCFDGSTGRSGLSLSHYSDKCYRGVAWNGSSVAPAGSTRVPVTPGATTRGINVALAASLA